GFQAGVIFASAFILYSLVFGLETAQRVLPAAIRRILLGSGVLIYAGTGIAGILMGGNFLNYSVLAHDPLSGQHLGIMLIEFGVGTTVFAAMVIIFFTFAGQYRRGGPDGN
ncbi:MAG: Na(+)/H(+) antiporter subunit B, partial [Rhodospirillales bacterium]|nr:Na(+)/H(+) antiporter subunit B [Rhodospirillales bacterium]